MSEIDDILSGKTPLQSVDGQPQSDIDRVLSTAPSKGKGILGHVRDTALSLGKSAIAVPETVVGLADIVTGGQVGKTLENKDGMLGFRPKEAKEYLSGLQTDQYKAQQQQFSDADGVIAKTGVALSNPSLITNAVAESIAPMLAGGVVARGIGAVAPRVAGLAAGAIGEGAVMAGGQAEQIRQQTDDGLLSAEQSGAAVATGALGSAFGYAGGRLAKRLGITDVDTLIAQGGRRTEAQLAEEAAQLASRPAKSIPRKVIEGAISEGFLEELPQSISEQILQNLALDKPWSEGVEDAAVMGTLAGMAMGGGASMLGQGARPSDPFTPPNDQTAPIVEPPQAAPMLALPAPSFNVGADGVVMTAADQNAAIQAQRQVEADRQDRINRGEILDVTPIPSSGIEPIDAPVIPVAPKPSEQMGLDPNAGPMSSAAALAVDSGASQQLANQQAQQQAEELEQKQAKKRGESTPTNDLTSAAQLSQEVPAASPAFPKTTADHIKDGMESMARNALSATRDQVASYIREGKTERLTYSKPEAVENAVNNKDYNVTKNEDGSVTVIGVRSSDGSWVGSDPTLQSPASANRSATSNSAQELATPQPVQDSVQADPAARWSSMTANERKVVAANTDIKPVIAKNLSRANWDLLNPDVQQKLTSSMQSQNDTSFTPPKDVSDLASQWVAAHNKNDKVQRQKLLNYGNEHFNQNEMSNAVNDAMAKNATASTAIESAANEAATSPQNDKPTPTEAQKEAGNYAKGHVRVSGLDISIENPQGSERTGKREDGSTWSHKMSDHYGYIKRTEGADGDHVDVYVGGQHDAERAYIVNQINQKTGEFDEHKVMLGYETEASAVRAYKSNFDKNWKVGPVTAMSTDDFKSWLKDGDTTKPVAANAKANDKPKSLKEGIAKAQENAKEAKKPLLKTGDKITFNGKFDYAESGDSYVVERVGVNDAKLKSENGSLTIRTDVLKRFMQHTPNIVSIESANVNANKTKAEVAKPETVVPKSVEARSAEVEQVVQDVSATLVSKYGWHRHDDGSLTKLIDGKDGSLNIQAKFDDTGMNVSVYHHGVQVPKTLVNLYSGKTTAGIASSLDINAEFYAKNKALSTERATLEEKPKPTVKENLTVAPVADEPTNKENLSVESGSGSNTTIKSESGITHSIPNSLIDQTHKLSDVVSELASMRSDSQDIDGQREFTQKLLNEIVRLNPDVKIRVVRDLNQVDDLMIRSGLTSGGYYDPKTNTAYVYPNAEEWEGSASNLLNHELVHAVTADSLFDGSVPEETLGGLDGIRAKIKQHLFDNHEGMSEHLKDRLMRAVANNDELLSVGIGEHDAHVALKDILSKSEFDKLNSGFEQISNQPSGFNSNEKQGGNSGINQTESDTRVSTDANARAKKTSRLTPENKGSQDNSGADTTGSNSLADKSSEQSVDSGIPNQSIQDFGEKIGGARKDQSNAGSGKKGTPKTSDSRPAWMRRFEINQIASSSKESEVGRWVISDKRKLDWTGNAKRMQGSYATKEEAEAAIPLVAVAQKHRVVASRHGEQSSFEIWRDISDRKRVKVVDKVFDTRVEALEYMAQHAEEIIETNTTFGEADLPRPENTVRTGVERRTAPVKDRDFMDTFGFRGVEFGNWNNQTERQELLDDAYDGLMDLADVMGIPPKAISLNGDLGLAFGARGQGLSGARAHYEQGKAVINLTKMNGAGSLAHEWFHALDHYFGRQDGKASAEWVVGKDGTRSLKPAADFGSVAVSSGFRGESEVRQEVRDAYNNVMQTMFKKAEMYVEDTAKVDGFVAGARHDVEQRLVSIRTELSEQKDPKYYKRNNKPATAEQLAAFDAIAQKILEGVNLDVDLKSVAPVRNVRSVMSGMRWTNDALEQLSAIYKVVRGRTGFNSEQTGSFDRLRANMTRYSSRLKMLSEAQSGTEKTKSIPTEFAMNAKELDQGRGTNYWTTPHEMAARAFQGYVEDKIAEQGGKSPFLNHAPANVGIPTPWGWKRPYPHGEERTAINAAFDKLVDVIENKETDKGVALYSKNNDAQNESKEPLQTIEQVNQQLVDRLGPATINKLTKDGKLRVVSNFDELTKAERDGILRQLSGELGVPYEDMVQFARRWHGSPYQGIEKEGFKLNKIGSGEGQQIYGHGIYFAENRDVAESYRGMTSKNNALKELTGELPRNATVVEAQEAERKGELTARASKLVKAMSAEGWLGFDKADRALQEAFFHSEWHDISPELQKTLDGFGGQLYSAEIPEDHELMDWDKQLINQPKNVSAGISAAFADPSVQKSVERYAKETKNQPFDQYSTGKDIYDKLKYFAGGARAASELLGKHGVSGLRYLDGSSRSEGEGTHNYVIWNEGTLNNDVQAHYSRQKASDIQAAITGIEGWHNPNTGETVLIAGNLAADNVIPTFLHETGGHAGMQGLMKPSTYNELMRNFDALVASGNDLAIEAKNRSMVETDPQKQRDELLPYLITVASKAQDKKSGAYQAIQRLIQRMISAVKAWAFEKHGISMTLTPNDMVALAERMVNKVANAQVGNTQGTQAAFSREADQTNIRFSRSGVRDIASQFSEASARFGENIKNVTVQDVKNQADYKLTDLMGLSLQALGRRQLVEIYGKMLPMTTYNRLVEQMDADKNDDASKADGLVRKWANLGDERQLAELMHDATLAQIDPDKENIEVIPAKKLKYIELKKRFDALSADAQIVYRGARDSYIDHHRKVLDAIKERIERSELRGEKKAALLKQMDDDFFQKIKGVYFPLSRFGKYTVLVRNGDGKVESVSRAETMAEAQELRKTLLTAHAADQGFVVDRVMLSKEFVASRDMVGRGFMTELYAELDKQNIPAKQKAELEDTLGQLYLSSLPDLSWAKHGIHRKGTPGFSQDARRAFAQNTMHGASYLAKLRYSDLLADELDAMQKTVDQSKEVESFDQPKAQRVVDEMNKRHESLMNPKSNSLSTALTSFGFIYHLGLSPASAMVNLTQTALVAYPVMGAKWGFDKAGAALLKASMEATKGVNDISKVLKDNELAAYNEAVRRGIIDVTMAHDLAGVAQGEDSGVMWKIRPIMRAASYLFHNAERFNRQVTFVAAYRLAVAAGTKHEQAIEQAADATYKGHFDYSAGNRPRVMQGNAAKVILLFKQYGQNMLYLLGRSAHQWATAQNPEDSRQAKRALAGIFAMHGLAAGALGLPFVTTLLAIASMIGGDDDEPWDAEVALRNMLADAFGAPTAEILSKGLSRATPWDISGRVGLDHMIIPDIQEGLEGQRLSESVMATALGAVAGIGTNVFKGIESIADGHVALGWETMMPVAIRNAMKSYRYATEGNIDKSGIEINAEFNAAALLGQFAGFSPSDARLATEGKSAIKSFDSKLKDRRTQLLTQFARAAMDKDQDGMNEARVEIKAFNEKNPRIRIQANNLMASVKNRTMRQAKAEHGVYLPTKRLEAMDEGRFAFE